MKHLLFTIALVFAGVIAFAQNIPAGMRMELTECEENNREYSVFSYKDADGTYGYYLSLGREFRLIESNREDGTVSGHIDHIDETCILLGSTMDEAIASLDSLLDLLNEDPGTVLEFPCRLATGAERLGEPSTATCFITKRILQGKRLCFQFISGRHTAQTDLTKSSIKSLKSGVKLYKKLHPKQV
ncbi:MAG: hypothetical protein IJM41_02755 [Bacteroidales bacterium]|nr:hypothetical protein [Bacteroidales bacterium]